MTKTITTKLCINCKHIKFDHFIADGSKCMHPKLVREETIKTWVNGTEKSCKRSPYCDHINTDGKCKFFEEKPKPTPIWDSNNWSITIGIVLVGLSGFYLDKIETALTKNIVDYALGWFSWFVIFMVGYYFINRGYKIKYEVK